MHYAINLGDLITQIAQHLVLKLLISDVIDQSGQTIEINCKAFDGIAVRMSCAEERADAIIQVMRMKLDRNQLRAYQSKTGQGSWKRI